MCKGTEGCKFYTYFTEDNAVEPRVCTLLTGEEMMMLMMMMMMMMMMTGEERNHLNC